MTKNSEEVFSSAALIRPSKEEASRFNKTVKQIDVSLLFEGARELSLLHRGEAYSLRITANDKLILTK